MNEAVIFFQMESHCDTDCPKAPIACNFSTFGCKERVSYQIYTVRTILENLLVTKLLVLLVDQTKYKKEKLCSSVDAAPQPGSAHAGVHTDAYALHGRVPAWP